jgi:hypothetical protein
LPIERAVRFCRRVRPDSVLARRDSGIRDAHCLVGRRSASSVPNVPSSHGGFAAERGLLDCSRRIDRCASQKAAMISRLTTFAVVFAVLGTASLTFAAQVQSRIELERISLDARAVHVIELPRVEVIGHRSR